METITHSLSSLASLFLISALAVLVVYRVFHRPKSVSSAPGWLELLPEDIGGFSYRQLILVSLLSLFVEMLMIRWVSSEIRIFAYFKNFVLIACFLGFGLGCYLSRRRANLATTILPLITLAVICELPLDSLRQFTNGYLPTALGSISQVDIWGVPT